LASQGFAPPMKAGCWRCRPWVPGVACRSSRQYGIGVGDLGLSRRTRNQRISLARLGVVPQQQPFNRLAQNTQKVPPIANLLWMRNHHTASGCGHTAYFTLVNSSV